MLRVWVTEVKSLRLHAGAKKWETLNPKEFELDSVGEGEVVRQGSDKDWVF